MNRKIKNLILTIFIAFFLGIGFAQADDITYTVDNLTTTTGQACLDGVADDCSFKSALALTNAYPNPDTDKVTINFDSSLNGQTLFIDATTYILSRSNVDIIGLGVDNFAIDFSGYIVGNDWGSGFHIRGSDKDNTIGNVTISDLKIVNSPATKHYYLVWIYNAHDVLIDNCEFGNSGYDVLHIGNYTNDITVQNTEIYGADYGRNAPGWTATIATGLCSGLAQNSNDFDAPENANYRDCLPTDITVDTCYLHDANPNHGHYTVHGGFNHKIINSTLDMNELGATMIIDGFELSGNTFTGTENLYLTSNPTNVEEAEVVRNPSDYVISNNTFTNAGLYLLSNSKEEYFFEGLEISDNTITNGDIHILGEAQDLVIDNNDIDGGAIKLSNLTKFSNAEVTNNIISNFPEFGISVSPKSNYLTSAHTLSYNGVDYNGVSNPADPSPNFLIYFLNTSENTQVAMDDTAIPVEYINDAKNRGGFSGALINFFSTIPVVFISPSGRNATNLASCQSFAGSLFSTCHAFKMDYFEYDSATDQFTFTGLDGFEVDTPGEEVTFYAGDSLTPPHLEDEPYIRNLSENTEITFSGNVLQNSNNSPVTNYYSSFHPLAYDGVDYVSDMGAAGGDEALFYQNNDASEFVVISSDDTLIDNSDIIDQAKTADGFMMILISFDPGSGMARMSGILPNGAIGVSDLASCDAVVAGAYGGTCDAIKLDYFDYNETTEEFEFTGLSGFETAGSTVSLASSYSGDPYLTKQLECEYAAYNIEGSSNTFTNETVINVGNGFYFNNYGVSNDLNYSELSSTCSTIKQYSTKVPLFISEYVSSLHPLAYDGVDYVSDADSEENEAMLYQDLTSGLLVITENNTTLPSTVSTHGRGAGGFMMILATIDPGGDNYQISVLVPKDLMNINDLASCSAAIAAAYGGTCEAIKYNYFDYNETTEELEFTGLSGFETAGGTVSLASSYSGDPYINKIAPVGYDDLTNVNYLNNTSFGGEEATDVQSGAIEVSYDVQLKINDQSGVVVSDASVIAEDSQGNTTNLGSTNASGLTTLASLKAYRIDPTGINPDYNPYSFTVNHIEFLERIDIGEVLQDNPEILFHIGPTFGGLSLIQYYVDNPALSEAPGEFMVEFNIGDAVDGIPIGGQIVLTFPDEFTIANNADISGDIIAFTDDGTDISANIAEARALDNTISVSITNQDIEKQSIILLNIDGDVISQNPSEPGEYYVQMTTKDQLGAVLDTGYIPVVIGGDLVMQVNVQEAMIINIDNTSILLNLDPGVNNGEDYSQKSEITIQSNSPNGYIIQTMIDGGSLLNGSHSLSGGNAKVEENKIGYIAYNNPDASEITKTKEELQTDASAVYGFTGLSNGLRLYDGTENGIGLTSTTDNQKHTVYYVVNVDYGIAPGLYSGAIVFTALPRF